MATVWPARPGRASARPPGARRDPDAGDREAALLVDRRSPRSPIRARDSRAPGRERGAAAGRRPPPARAGRRRRGRGLPSCGAASPASPASSSSAAMARTSCASIGGVDRGVPGARGAEHRVAVLAHARERRLAAGELRTGRLGGRHRHPSVIPGRLGFPPLPGTVARSFDHGRAHRTPQQHRRRPSSLDDGPWHRAFPPHRRRPSSLDDGPGTVRFRHTADGRRTFGFSYRAWRFS